MDIVELADRLWRGEASTAQHHPVVFTSELVEVTDGVAFLPAFANCTALRTEDGLVMVDTGSPLSAHAVHTQIRAWSRSPLHTAIFSHGHIDHVFGVGAFDEENEAAQRQRVRVLAHEHLPARFERYVLTAGYNEVVNRRQFGVDNLIWPREYRFPDETYRDEHHVEVGGLALQLRHEKGETDDATVTWIPQRGVLCTGDLFIWSSPNAGNPQKVQRYPAEWAAALRRMAELNAEMLLPGHGLPVIGPARVAQALVETAEYLESLVAQTLALMNAGARLSEILETVRAPAHLADRAFLQPVYDEPEFIVHNIWRLYGGWWDGNPASLKPAPERVLAAEVAALAGGARRLAARAEELAGEGTDEALRVAGHLIELAWLDSPGDAGVAGARAAIFAQRANLASSTMAKGVFNWAARESTGSRF